MKCVGETVLLEVNRDCIRFYGKSQCFRAGQGVLRLLLGWVARSTYANAEADVFPALSRTFYHKKLARQGWNFRQLHDFFIQLRVSPSIAGFSSRRVTHDSIKDRNVAGIVAGLRAGWLLSVVVAMVVVAGGSGVVVSEIVRLFAGGSA